MSANGTPAEPQDQLVSLDAIATEIGTKGATGDAVLADLAKGVKDAVATMSSLVSGLVDLAKGKSKASDDDDDGDKDDDTDSGDGAPGYQDMQMAVRGVQPVGQPVNGGADFDATQFLLDTAANVQALVKGQNQLRAENAELRTELRAAVNALGTAIQRSAEAQLQIAGPLAKAVAESREQMLLIPAAGITPTNMRPRPRASDAALIGGSERTEKQTLAKGFRLGLFDAEQLANFKRSRRFDADEAVHQSIRAKVDATAKDFTSAG